MNDLLPKITLDTQTLQNIDYALCREWLVTNGIGGYASSTVLGANTRKYHGLLVAALNPPTNRYVLLSKLDEEIQIDNETHKLAVNEFCDTFYPKPQGLIQEFSLNPFPAFRYQAGKVMLEKTVFMPTGKNAVVIAYDARNEGETPAFLRVFPLINFRHFHCTTKKDQAEWRYNRKQLDQRVVFQYKVTPKHVLLLSTDKGKYHSGQEFWIEKIFFRMDAARREDCFDDCIQSGYFEIEIDPKKQEKFSIIAIAGDTQETAERLLGELRRDDGYAQELKLREALLMTFQKQYTDVRLEDWLKWLILATDSFIVHRASTKTKSVIAGYHWFEDWGRDSLVSLPGLTLVTGRFSDAREILSTFKHYCKEGVVPNRFPDWEGDKPEYNTVDASLWYVNAALQYVKYTGDSDFVQKELWNTLQSIVENYARGTLNNIHMDSDGLIAHSSRLTWMDATVNHDPVTPRAGKAVEIQALWYNALRTMQQLAEIFSEKKLEEKYTQMAEKTERSFVEKFWNAEKGCLFDVVDDGRQDLSLRSNQIIAVSLDFSMLDEAKSEAVVNSVQSKLWTEYGLRTLSTDDSRYMGKYFGNQAHRNQAYHNGTIWSWLLGPFVTAFLKVRNHDTKWREFALQRFLQPFFQKTVLREGLGTVGEIFEGDPPHVSCGCIAQAWSVAEPFRALVEDALFRRPPFERKIDLK